VPTRIVETSEAAETEELGAELAATLRPGDLVLVRGDLGAGKTTFVRGAARALGVRAPVTSPTFSIGHLYRTDRLERLDVAHLDLYRLSTLAAEEPDLLADYLDSDRIAFVEWPPQGEPELMAPRLVVTIHHADGDARRIEVRE
jgi:tRNA threonylcarbamoyladenosine biosynthesis protein TsaE